MLLLHVSDETIPVAFCSISFSVDLSKSPDQISVEDMKPPPLIRDNPGFSLLLLHDES